MSRIALVLSLVAVVLGFFAFQGKQAAPSPAPVAEFHHEEEEEEVEVAIHMGRIQRYHQKWWAAGKAGNKELAAFYLHEMEESMERIAEARLLEDGVDVSANMGIYGLKAVEALEKKLETDGVAAMYAEGSSLVISCNGCHTACGYPFIRIQEPKGLEFPDQNFAPVAK